MFFTDTEMFLRLLYGKQIPSFSPQNKYVWGNVNSMKTLTEEKQTDVNQW